MTWILFHFHYFYNLPFNSNRHDICSTGTSSCGLLGLAYVGAACNPARACSINEDTGLALGATVAHEMGHK